MSATSTLTRLINLSQLHTRQPEPDIANASHANSRSSGASNPARDSDGEAAPADAVEAVPDGGYGWTIVSACSFLLFWINGYNTSWGVLQTELLASSYLYVNVRTLAFVGSLALAGLVAFGLLSVRLMRRFGTRYMCVIAVVLFSLGPILSSFSLHDIGGLFVTAGLLVGFGSSVPYTATNTLPIQWFSGKLGLANGLVKMGGGLGATVLPLAAQALIDSYGLPWAFRILGFLMFATGVPAALMLKERTLPGQASRFDWSLLKNIPFLALSMAGAIGVFALYVPPYFLPLFARSIGLSPSTGAGLVAGFGGATTLGRFLCGWACDRIGAFNTLAITVLVNSLSMLAIWPVSTSLPPLLIFALINGCANGGFFVTLLTAVAKLAPGSAGLAISIVCSAWAPGYLLGPPIAGILIEATGAAESSSIRPYRAAIFYAAGTGFVAAFLAILARMRLDKKLLKKL